MNQCKIWIEQCEAARGIENEFGTLSALKYLVGEKFMNYLQAAESDTEFRADLPAFVAEIKTIFEPWQLAEYLEKAGWTEPFDASIYEDDAPEDIEMERKSNLRRAANEMLLIERDASSGQTTIRYAYDGDNAWADMDGSNNLATRRLFGPGADNPVVKISSAGVVVWYLLDYQNSVIGMVNSSGASLGSVTYDGFGKALTNTLGTNADAYMFQGARRDTDTGLDYHDARWYDPNTGTWISRDPGGFAMGDANLYRAMGNALTDGVDSSGKWTLSLGLGFDGMGIFFRGAAGVAVHLGVSGDGLSFGVSLDYGGFVGLGAGGGIGPSLGITSARNVPDLGGWSDTGGAFYGPFVGTGIVGPGKSYYGGQLGLSWGWGAGVFNGGTRTRMAAVMIRWSDFAGAWNKVLDTASVGLNGVPTPQPDYDVGDHTWSTMP
jgi:RHS repeat-associated protein